MECILDPPYNAVADKQHNAAIKCLRIKVQYHQKDILPQSLIERYEMIQGWSWEFTKHELEYLEILLYDAEIALR